MTRVSIPRLFCLHLAENVQKQHTLLQYISLASRNTKTCGRQVLFGRKNGWRDGCMDYRKSV